MIVLCGSIATVFYSKSASARENVFDSGLYAMRMGDYRTAQLILKGVTERDPSNALAFYEAGNAAYLLGDVVEAARCWTEAIRIEPNMRKAHIALGGLHLSKGEVESYERRLAEHAQRLKESNSK